MTQDLNDKLKNGTLPADPAQGATVMAADVPRVKTVAELLVGGQERALSKFHKATCGTGHFAIDDATGGMKPGFVWVFGADTSWGKSSFLIMLADENIKVGRRVLIVSAEDDEKIYGDRLLIRRSRVSADRFRKHKLERADHDAIAKVVQAGEDEPCFLDARGRSVEWVCARVAELIKEYNIDVVAFDYLQAFDSDKRHEDRRVQVGYIARALTNVVKLANVSGIIFSQITIQEGKSHPDKHSIRENRDVSNAAEVVMLGFTPEKPIKSKGQELDCVGKKCIFVDKVKDGVRGGTYVMDWNEECACFDASLSEESKRYHEITGGEFDNFGDHWAPNE